MKGYVYSVFYPCSFLHTNAGEPVCQCVQRSSPCQPPVLGFPSERKQLPEPLRQESKRYTSSYASTEKMSIFLFSLLLACAQSCPTLCDPFRCLPGSSVHGISQARTLEWVIISILRGSSRPKDRTQVSCVSCIVCGFFTH